MNTMQQELRDTYPALRIQLLGVNDKGHEAGNPSVTANRTLPWLQDVDGNSDGTADVHASWEVTFRDIVILDGSNAKVGVYNVTSHDLANAANFATLREMLVDAAMASQRPWQNASNALDVDNNNGITPLDVLIVINRLNSVGPGALSPPVTAQLSPPFFDTSGDNEVTALDALRVINHLNAAAAVAGEGEGPLPTTAGLAGPTERIAITPNSPAFAKTRTNGLLPQLHSASTQDDRPGDLAENAWRVGVDLVFADDTTGGPLERLGPAPSRAQSELTNLDEWWLSQAER